MYLWTDPTSAKILWQGGGFSGKVWGREAVPSRVQLQEQHPTKSIHHVHKEILLKKSERMVFVTTYNTENIKGIINRDIIKCDRTLNQIFPEPPLTSFRRFPTLPDKPVHRYLPPNTNIKRKPGESYKCNQCNRCNDTMQTKT